jgi:hypothetical protein
MILSIPFGFYSSEILASISSKGCNAVFETKEAINETMSEIELIFASYIEVQLLEGCALFILGQS